MEEMNKKEIKNMYNEEYGDIRYYGEFVSSYFGWVTQEEFKQEVSRLENITKKEGENDI